MNVTCPALSPRYLQIPHHSLTWITFFCYTKQNIINCSMCSIQDDRKKPMSDNDERQEQLLRAAAVVIIRQGYDKTTMSDIADEAGVSRGTVYLYFKGKEELLEALLYWEWMQ